MLRIIIGMTLIVPQVSVVTVTWRL